MQNYFKDMTEENIKTEKYKRNKNNFIKEIE